MPLTYGQIADLIEAQDLRWRPAQADLAAEVKLRGMGADRDGLTPAEQAPRVNFSELPVGLNCVLLAIGCCCAADIAAYIFGKQIGRTRLSEISPKKTVEGALGGFGASGLTGALSSMLQWPN